MKDLRHWYYYMLMLTSFIAMVIIALLTFWSVYPYNPIEFKGEEFKILTPVVKQGGLLEYVTDYCKHMDITSKVTRQFVNEILYSIPDVESKRSLGCGTVNVLIIVPSELPPGKYHMHIFYEYQVNPIRKVTVIHQTQNFEVISSKE